MTMEMLTMTLVRNGSVMRPCTMMFSQIGECAKLAVKYLYIEEGTNFQITGPTQMDRQRQGLRAMYLNGATLSSRT